MKNNQLINNAATINLFNSYVDRLATVYNDGFDNAVPEIQTDAVYLACKKRIEAFLEAHSKFDVIQTYAVLPDSEEYGKDVVDAVESNDYGYIIKKFGLDVKFDEPLAIQTVFDQSIVSYTDDYQTYSISGGILLINPTENGFEVDMSYFTQIDGVEGLGISHKLENYKLEEVDGDFNFVKVHQSGFEEDVDNNSFEAFLLMQIPLYLAMKKGGHKLYAKVVMERDLEDNPTKVHETNTVQ